MQHMFNSASSVSISFTKIEIENENRDIPSADSHEHHLAARWYLNARDIKYKTTISPTGSRNMVWFFRNGSAAPSIRAAQQRRDTQL